MSLTCWRVELELKRIQTYLFEVPRLSVMVGANALLGETLRGLWNGSGFDAMPPSLPHLAQACGACLPQGVPLPASSSPGDDPLFCNGVWQDDVVAVAEKTGVLVRDGGRFHAVFNSLERANLFCDRAGELLQRQLPGVLYVAKVVPLAFKEGLWRKGDAVERGPLPEGLGLSVCDIPEAIPCEWAGHGPASDVLRFESNERASISREVKAKRDRGRLFDDGGTRDVLGILRSQLLEAVGAKRFAEDLEGPDAAPVVATSGFIAVVHLDGNDVGGRYSRLMEPLKNSDEFERWRRGEAFFQPIRQGMRRALCGALKDVFSSKDVREFVPLRVLMLGGDDLLLACDACRALPLVVALEKNLATLKDNEGKRLLTFGAGVVIAGARFPFHRLHGLAEELARSAKLRTRDASAVDWLFTTESMHEDVAATRRRQAIVRQGKQRLLLTARPYRVADEPKVIALSSLLQHAHELIEETTKRDSRIARSQLRALSQTLASGRYAATLAAMMLPPYVADFLKARGYLDADHSPWTAVGLSRVADLVELYELESLGTGSEK